VEEEKPKHRDPPFPKGNRDQAEVFAEQADAYMDVMRYADAIPLYRQALQADRSYAAAWHGLYKAGLGTNDKKVILEGGKGYLRADPDASDADAVQEAISSQE
jgi:tetratricopeptide (TPR) repeat protein